MRRPYVAEMQISNRDLELHVAEDGDASAPPLLLIHGITSSTRTWSWLIPTLAPRYRVLRLDLRGHGGSGRAPGTYDMDGYVSDAVATVEQAAGRPSIVIGHSLGGATAIGLAQARPDLVRALVLEDPPLIPAEHTHLLDDSALMVAFRLIRESVPRLQATGIPPATVVEMIGRSPSAVGVPMSDLIHSDAIEANALGLFDLDATVLDPVLDASGRAALDTGTTIEVPTLLIAADPNSPDAVARPEGVEAFRSVCPGVEVRVVPGASHLIHDELVNRSVFVDLVTDFLGRLEH
jgi:pimeloyl-ACP methyl ester carboxylesterase